MSARNRIQSDPPDRVVKPQHAASDPTASAWASANAGSGKTHVLTQRVIKLLLGGEDPAKILCITFTKAAAATMATRVFDTLAAWTALDDAALDEAIRKIGMAPTEKLRTRARQLFALALETPGGLKVQTIHAFCTSLLHQFPFEAEVGAGFEVLDDVTQTQMLDKLTLEVMLEGAAQPDSTIGKALAAAIRAAADQTFRELIMEAVGERDRIEAWVARAGSVDAAIAELSAALGLGAHESAEAIEAEILTGGIDPADWPAFAAVLVTGKKTDREQAERFLQAAKASGPGRIERYTSIFCTGSAQTSLAKRSCRKDIVTSAIKKSDPDLAERLSLEKDRIEGLLNTLRAVECRDRTHALLAVAHEVIVRYRREKLQRGLLDYDDLIDRTLALFKRTSAQWVLYKLDLGINHLLLDEAQDTSPKQWEIIRTLVSEFTAGAGARGVKRTMFAVGDDKQSIFSFQGAAPEKFSQMREDFERDFKAAKIEWRNVKLLTSFRSGEIILQAVDAVFAQPNAYEALSAEKTQTVHEALPGKLPGQVDIWPLVLPDDKNEIEGWDAPFDQTSETSPQVKLAKKIAAHVALWQTKGTKPGDILVLVRQRGPLFEAIIRALKSSGIRVAGADRLVLLNHIAVMDLIALADALLLEEDDLALAAVLKSPLFGLSEQDLFTIAHDRKQPLRKALFGKAGEFPEAANRLKELTDAALRETPFTFYARLLGAGGGRKRFLARLGPEANDALDEFLNLALEYERRETPSLQGFVAWLRAANAEVKRDMELARDEVRVMTVHGAKGLEAHTVILADTTTRPEGYRHPALIDVRLAGGDGVIWAKSKDTDPEIVAGGRRRALDASIAEYKRLLYVAMTRAEQRLVICGTASTVKSDGTPGIPQDCWYRLIESALVQSPSAPTIEVTADDGDGTIWRMQKDVFTFPEPAEQKEARAETPLPDWIDKPVLAEPPSATAIRPSDADEAEWKRNVGEVEREKALERGRLLHRLIQSLPDVPPERRSEAADDFLRRNRKRLSPEECTVIAAQALAILDDAQFAPLFAPGSRAEVALTGFLPREGLPPARVTGQIDRLAVTEHEVLIGDYKTNRPAPTALDEVPHAYLRQLALYRALLQRIYPGRAVRAALIWTENATLMELPQAAMDAELATPTPA